ncbi:MAG: NAD(P)H-dependent oxidoreductase, partial [Phreatobacter sp.]
MRFLIVYCHPCPESFTAALRDAAVAALRRGGHELRVLDLHAEGFDPVMSAEERRAYHTAGVNEVPVAEHLQALRWCEALLFVYPTWWYGLPAMLKGWLDRVWVPHATFGMPEGRMPIGRVMTNIRFIGAISTLGSPWWWWRLVMSEPGRRTLLTGLSVICNPLCKKIWLALHEMDSATLEQRTAFLAKVEKRF